MKSLHLSFVIGVVWSTAVSARLYNYEDIPLGERAFGMGNTAIAVQNADTAAMYYNPAVLGLSDHSQVSASLSAFSRVDSRAGEFVNIFRSAQDNITRTGFFAIPSMVGGHLKLGSWVWGGTALVPTSFENQGILEPSTENLVSFEAKDTSYWYGMFLARNWGAHSFGLSIFYLSHENIEKFQFIRKSDQRLRLFEEGWGASGCVAVLGGTYRVSDSWLLGYSLRTRPVTIGGSAHVVDVASDRTSVVDTETKTSFYPLPWRFSVGSSWQVNPRLLWAVDLHFYTKVKGNIAVSEIDEFNVDAHPIANFGVGVEYMAFEQFGGRLGVFTNFSFANKLSSTLTVINDKVHMLGATAALVMRKKEGSISLGGYVQGGQGHGPDVREEPDLAPRTNYFYGFVVGSSYKF